MLEKPKLFLTLKEFWGFVLLSLLLLSLRLFIIYGEYRSFVAKPFYFTQVDVLQAYEKKGKKNRKYIVLKVHSSEFNLDFFTTAYYLKSLNIQKLRLKLFPSKELTFMEYLGTPLIASHINRVVEGKERKKDVLKRHIAKQHHNVMITHFYQAIFLAEPIDKKLRDEVSKLGISHLIALSGFHLAILSAILFFLIQPLYRYFHQHYFPYRYTLVDIGFVVLILLAWYVYFVGSPASLLRSYAMMFMGWCILLVGIELISFTFLATIVLILLVLFPKMLLSLAFWFSVTGVFYIFLLLQYFAYLSKYTIMVLISFGLFFLMLPIVHFIFPLLTLSQLFSPILSLFFSLFYPLSMGLHLLGIGDLLDTMVLKLFTYKSREILFVTPNIFFIFYLFISLLSIYFRWAFYLLLLFLSGFTIWMFSGFWV